LITKLFVTLIFGYSIQFTRQSGIAVDEQKLNYGPVLGEADIQYTWMEMLKRGPGGSDGRMHAIQ